MMKDDDVGKNQGSTYNTYIIIQVSYIIGLFPVPLWQFLLVDEYLEIGNLQYL